MAGMNFLAGLSRLQLDLLAFGLLVQGAVFTVFPEEVIFVALGVAVRAQRIPLVEAILVGQSGVLLANAATVWLGGRLGWGLLTRRPFSYLLKEAAIRQAVQVLQKSAARLIFVTRFTPLVRGPIYFAAGIAGIRVRQTFPIDAAASCLQVPLWVFVGTRMADSLTDLSNVLRAAALLGGLAITAVLWRARAEAAK